MASSIAQIFSSSNYVPTKCAVYLRPSGFASPAHVLSSNEQTVIDATNFLNVKNGSISILFSDLDIGYTGSGYIEAIHPSISSVTFANAPNANYPIISQTDGSYYIYLRGKGVGTVACCVDGSETGSVSFTSSSSWQWMSTKIIVPDNLIHTFSIKFLNTQVEIDKFVFSRTAATITGIGPNFTQAPYCTIHARLFASTNGIPTTSYNQFASVNTYNDVTKNGWYNFDTNLINGYTLNNTTNLALVLTATGYSDTHYVIWEIAENIQFPSATISNSVWSSDPTTSMSLRVYADLDSHDEYGCTITTPDATLVTTHIIDFNHTISPLFNNTSTVNDTITGGNDVELDVGPKLFTIILDQSGSMTWNDSDGARHSFALGFIDALDARYPSPVRFNLLKIHGEPAFSFLIPLPQQLDSNSPSDIIKAAFANSDQNFAGFRVLRNDKHFPTTPIDGEIVNDGYALAALDINLSQNTQYYYTVYTYDQFDRFSEGVQITATTNTRGAPRGIPTFNVSSINGYDQLKDVNIVAMWNMDEGSGNFVYDWSASNIPLFITNTQWLTEFDCPTGLYGLRLNGYSSTVQSQSTSLLSFNKTDQFTISGWLNPFGGPTNSPIVVRSASGHFNWSAILDNTTLKFTMNGTTFAVCSTTIPVETWSHFAIVYNAGAVSFYINGKLKNNTTLTTTTVDMSSMTLNLGNDPSNTLPNRFFGKISHIQVHNVARNASYISNLAQPVQRFSPLSGGRLPPDNGDRLVVVEFEVPEDYDYTLIRVVRNDIRIPNYESDGYTVLETSPIVGVNTFGLAADYDVDNDYWFRVFTKNSLGNWSSIEDSIGVQIHIPDQDRPHIVINLAVGTGPGNVFEINPGPDFGVTSPPVITTARAGNAKNFFAWLTPVAPATRVKIYYSTQKYAVYNGQTRFIDGTLIFSGIASLDEFVHRNLPNLVPGYYTFVTTDRLGRFSNLENISPLLIPQVGLDDSGIPLLEALNVAYHLVDYDRIKITWDSPVTISSNNSGYFDDVFYFYGAICDLYGNPIPLDYPDQVSIVTSIASSNLDKVVDVFDSAPPTDTLSNIPTSGFTVNPGGLISGQIRLNNSTLFSVLLNMSIGVTAQYKYSDTFTWNFPTSTIAFNNPLSMTLYNRDSLYLQTADFSSPLCFNPFQAGGSDNVDSLGNPSPFAYRVNGCYIRRSTPLVIRAVFSYKGLPVQSGIVNAQLYDSLGGPCGIAPINTQIPSLTLSFQSSVFNIQTGTIPVFDSDGNPTSQTQVASYADIPIISPQLPQSGSMFVRIESQSFQFTKQADFFFPTIIQLSLSAAAPVANGIDVREQFTKAWLIDPDFPNDQTKIQILPDNTIIQWTMTQGGSNIRNVPFYSTDTVPLTGGVFSYLRSGTARFVFFGPAKAGIGGSYLLTSSVNFQGLSASQSAKLNIAIPGSGGFTNYIPDPTVPRILAEMPQCINYLWADGSDYVKMTISRNPISSTTKYASTFRTCSVDSNGHSTLFPLPIGTVVTINATGYEIIWGSVVEIIDEVSGVKQLNTNGAFNAQDTASLALGTDNYTYVYFRQNAVVTNAGCRDVVITNCACFDLATRICDDPNIIGNDTGVVVSAKVNFNGKPLVIYGGGPLAKDSTSRPPTVLVPREPLIFNLVGVFVDGQPVQQVVVDGKTKNQFIFSMEYTGLPVPDGVPVDVLLQVVLNGNQVTTIGTVDIYTYFNVPKVIYTLSTNQFPGLSPGNQIYSLCSFTMNPIPTSDNIAIGIGVSTTYSGLIVNQISSSSSGN